MTKEVRDILVSFCNGYNTGSAAIEVLKVMGQHKEMPMSTRVGLSMLTIVVRWLAGIGSVAIIDAIYEVTNKEVSVSSEEEKGDDLNEE